MEIKIRKLNSVEMELEVKLNQKEVLPLREKIYAEFQSKVEIPGYRLGKAPLELVLKKYRSEIEHDLKDSIVNFFYKRALKEAKLIPITKPLLLDSSLALDGSAKFLLKVEEKPEVKLSSYRGLKLQREKISVKDEEVEEALQKLKKERSQWLDVDRQAREGDFLVLDLKITNTSNQVLEKKENIAFLLEKDVIFIELLNNLVGLKKGSDKEFVLDVPEGFYDKKIAGKRCRFFVKVKQVKEKKEPLLDDYFAKEIGNYENLDELKDSIRIELKNYKDRKAETDLEEKLIQDLISQASLELPSQLVQLYSRRLAEDIVLRLLYKGIPKEDVEKQMEDIWQEAQREAQKQLKIYFILEEIAEREKIEVSEQEFEDHVNKLAQIQKVSKEELISKLKEGNGLGNLRQQLKRSKVIQFIKENAQIETV